MAPAESAGGNTRDAISARREHWQSIYVKKMPAEVSWYQETPEPSLALIHATGVEASAGIIDVGGGASTLVDHLLSEGFHHVSVLDVAAASQESARRRLGAAADSIDWVVEDVTKWRPPAPFDLWHDRAAFHFLTDWEDRQGYLAALDAGVRPGTSSSPPSPSTALSSAAAFPSCVTALAASRPSVARVETAPARRHPLRP